MFFRIDVSDAIPIYEQVIRQITYAIADQALCPGQLLPSARALSVELAINPNTVVRAFGQLQQDGILEPLRGRGLVVRAGATEICGQMRRDLIAQRLHSVLFEAFHSGLAKSEITSLVDRQLKSLAGSVDSVGADGTADDVARGVS